MKQIADITLSCGDTFDESLLFQGTESDILKQELKDHFFNITKILDCVTCEKCRLWGKVQINGLATALQVSY